MNHPLDVPEMTGNASDQSKLRWTIITQVKSNRVVYFTDDPTYEPHLEGDWYYCSLHLGVLPPEMTLRNCWGWRFNGSVFKDARGDGAKPKEEKLLDANRRALQKILLDKINAVRRPHLPSSEGGEYVRERKLSEAKAYLGKDVSRNTYPFLQIVAVSRRITLKEAAHLVLKRAEEFEEILAESERFREQFSAAIETAVHQRQLEEIRYLLVDEIYPELLVKSDAIRGNTTPDLAQRELGEEQVVHERMRLKVLLRERINKLRGPLHSQYIQNESARAVKISVAQKILLKQGIVGEKDQIVFSEYARARNLNELDAAKILLSSEIEAKKVLLESEILKDRFIARIDSALSRVQFFELERDISKIAS